MDNQTNPSDIFGRAARIGPAAGVYFTVLFLCAAYSGMHAAMTLLALALMLAVPWLLYRRLTASCAAGTPRRVSPLWTEGIYSFVFGSLIMALLVYLWMRFIDPDYLQTQLELASRLMRDYPDAASPEMHHAVDSALSQRVMPGPIQMAMSLFWTVTFTGAILSLLEAFIISKKPS